MRFDWKKFIHSENGMVLICISVMAVFFFIMAVIMTAPPGSLPFVGFRTADLSRAPDELIIRQGSWHKSISCESIDSLSIRLDAPTPFLISGRVIAQDHFYLVRARLKNRNYVNVSRKYDSKSYKDAGVEMQRIANACHAPVDSSIK